MTPSRWERLERLLERAGELPAPARAAFVERETAGEPTLRAELVGLLDASDGAAEYVTRLRREILGSEVPAILRDAPAAEDPDPWIGRTVSHYRILDRIGGGGMGVIYRARDLRLERTVALKFIAPEIRRDPEAGRRFLDEARAASALDHPNICTIHEIAETDEGRPYIVMAAYEGETLRARLARGPLPVEEALDLGEQVARALAAAHARGIVHRDVKPDNVFLTREGVVKLLDFGLARTPDSRMSGSGAVEGTVAYMSPEQAAGRRADARSDVWALGVILFEMLAGARPFGAADPGAVIDLILTRDPDLRTARPELPPEIIEIVHRALAKRPAERFAGGRELLEALQGCRSATGPAPAPSEVGRSGGSRRRVVRVGLAALALLALGTVVMLRIRANPDPPRPPLAPGSVAHVLWVDDDPGNNARLVRDLRGLGVEVTTARSTADALARYDPAVHPLVISDMGRYEGPGDAYVGRAGLELLARLRERSDRARLVFCTSSRAVTTHREEALAGGALEIFDDCSRILPLIGAAAPPPRESLHP